MKTKIIATLALALYWTNAKAAKPFDVPAECKNLALMETQLMMTQFHNDVMGGGTYNPSELTLKTANGYKIGKIEYLGGDSEETPGQYPCDLDPSLCTNPAGAGGGAIDWARVTVQENGIDLTQVIVSMGSRGGCKISSGKVL